MKRFPPVNWWRFWGQSLFFMLCCLSLWHLLDVVAEKRAYITACSNLAAQQDHLKNLEKSLQRYKLLRDRYLPCRQMDENLVWQNITVNFNNIDFATLIERLNFLYRDISSMYGEQGMFFLDEFLFETGSNRGSDGDTYRGAQVDVRRFVVKGRLLTPCSDQ